MPEFPFAEVWRNVSLLPLVDFRVMQSHETKIQIAAPEYLLLIPLYLT